MKEVKFTKKFEPTDVAFEAFYKAIVWLGSNGFSYGSMDCRNHIAIVNGEYNIPQKWHNLSESDIEGIEGFLFSTNFRKDAVEVRLFNEPNLKCHEA